MNYEKSVAIIGKGPSVLQGYSDMYNSFDEIACVNWPVIDNKYIPQRCDSMFTHYFGDNEIDEKRKKMILTSPVWDKDTIEKYKVKNIYCTIKNDENYIEKFIPKKIYNINITSNLRHINDLMNFHNDSGLFAITYYCQQPDVKNIFFIGFDAYIGTKIEDSYYFQNFPKKITGTLSTFKNDCHSRRPTIDYLQNLGNKYPDKQFQYKSKINFKEYSNFREYK